MPSSAHLRRMRQIPEVAQHAAISNSRFLARDITMVACVRADLVEYIFKDIVWQPGGIIATKMRCAGGCIAW